MKQYDVDSKLDVEDENGGFVDNKETGMQNIYDSKSNLKAIRTELLNARDISFLGPVFLGSPKSQGAMVVYDTGSDWLTVKSCFSEGLCHKKIDEKATVQKHSSV